MPPYFFLRLIQLFRNGLLNLNQRMFPGGPVLYEQIQTLWLLPSLYVAARLNIAGCLEAEPLTAEELARKVDVQPGPLARVMRAMISQGIFRQRKDGRYELNRRSRVLLDGKGSLRYMIIHHLGPVNWQNLGELLDIVKTGQDAFSRRYGKDIYAFLRENPDNYYDFDRSMSNLSDLSLAPMFNEYRFGRYHTIADIGGGEGFLLSAILSRNPTAQGILFDLPEALVNASSFLQEQHTEDRITIVRGDFLDDVPVKADLYLLKNIVHNWNDQHSALILSHIARHMPEKAKILIMEMIIPEHGGNATPCLLDIQMLSSFKDARERTLEEFKVMTAMAGLKVSRVIPTISPISLIEVTR